jgi:arginine deiminase
MSEKQMFEEMLQKQGLEIRKLRSDLKKAQHEAKDNKIKIDKAIKEIQSIIDYGFDYDGFNNVKDLKGLIDMLVDYAEKSKSILQGGDEE